MILEVESFGATFWHKLLCKIFKDLRKAPMVKLGAVKFAQCTSFYFGGDLLDLKSILV